MSHPPSTPVIVPPAGSPTGTGTGTGTGIGRMRRAGRVSLAIGIALVAALLALARIPDSARGTVWAEDGVYFLADSDREGVWATLFKPYMGYLHVLPRLIVISTSQFAQLSDFAILVTVICCLAVGALTSLVFWCSAAVTTWLPARLAIASITVLVPTAPIEVLGNAANLHWYLLWGSVWLLLYTPKTWVASVALGFLGLSFALTEILVALLAPLVFYRFREARMWPVRIGFALGLSAQAVATLSNPRPPSANAPDVVTTVYGYLIQGVTTAIVPFDSALGNLLADTGVWVGALIFIPFGLSWLYLLWRGRAVVRIAAITLLGLSITVFALAFHGVLMSDYWNYPEFSDTEFRNIVIQRYSVITSMCLLPLPILAIATARDRWMTRAAARASVMLPAEPSTTAPVSGLPTAAATVSAVPAAPAEVSAVPSRARRVGRGVGRVAVAALPLVVVVAMLPGFVPEVTRKDGHPQWADTVAQAREDCTRADSPGWGSMQAAPGGDWDTILSCVTLRSGAGNAEGSRR